MHIGILGQPCIDEIVHVGTNGARPMQSFALGGILYSLAAMERLMKDRGSLSDRFTALMWLSEPDKRKLEPLLCKFERMSDDGLWPTSEPCNQVQLVYDENGDRTEHCPHILPPVEKAQLTPELLESLDGLFVNMISGFDVSLDTLELALSNCKKRPYIHLDIHALVLGSLSERGNSTSYGGGRTPHGVHNWRRWLSLADSVQLNELEVRWLADPEITTEHHLLKVLEQRTTELPKQIIITRAAKGASLYDLTDGEVHHSVPPPVKTMETTGSGDVFGAAFIFFMLKNWSTAEALHEAVRWASWNTTLKTIDQILSEPLP